MRVSVVTPNYNGEQYLEKAIKSVISQRESGVELEYIIVDGGSTDGSLAVIDRYASQISHVISERDHGSANAINKGLKRASGDILCWLNADDRYCPGALKRVVDIMADHPNRALCFGHCPIIDENDEEIRVGITRLKEFFFPISSRFTIQCINYISQPAMFFRRTAFEKVGPLREDFMCAWDYDFIIRLWRHGGAVCVKNPPLAAFRWHETSLSGQYYCRQFKEEWDVAARDAGRFSLQALIHLGVRWGIVWSYLLMARLRQKAMRDDRRQRTENE